MSLILKCPDCCTRSPVVLDLGLVADQWSLRLKVFELWMRSVSLIGDGGMLGFFSDRRDEKNVLESTETSENLLLFMSSDASLSSPVRLQMITPVSAAPFLLLCFRTVFQTPRDQELDEEQRGEVRLKVSDQYLQRLLDLVH